MSPSALSGGYGVQSQFVPRGTESPSATTDHVRDFVVEDEADSEDRPQPAATAVSTTTPATARPRRRVLTPRV